MTFVETLNALITAGIPVVSVTVVDVKGSVPNDQGAKMLVTEAGLHSGTVGGGRVESKAIDQALVMLRSGGPSTTFADWQLNRDVGMTCGGSVKLFFEAYNVAAWEIVVFGAGHVAQALIPVLLGFDCRVTCFDTRQEWLSRLPSSPRLRTVASEDMAGEIRGLPDGAYVVLMTMGHATDLPILAEILRTRDFPFLGVIGSRAKANILERDLVAAGLPDEATRKFHCPIGLPIGSNHPGEIAVSIAAQLIQERDRLLGGRPTHVAARS
jgi:xanthine dehydrogenase accessory factor